MIGFGVFLGEDVCYIEKKHMYAICTSKPFADGYAKELSDASKFEYKVKRVKIVVLE